MNDSDQEKLQELINLLGVYQKAYKEEERKLPYHLNVIEELHPNENSNSRILGRLFQYRNNDNEHIFLTSFITALASKNSNFSKIKVEKPTITVEESRIDIWVCDKNYAIIFENKAYDATDQEAQIARYINLTKEKGYEDERIYVVYLPKDGKEPAPQTWRIENKNEPDESKWESYEPLFKERYVNFSFKDGVLPWFTSLGELLSQLHPKEKFIRYAIEEYVDYLEGYVGERESIKNMNVNIQNKLKEAFGLTDEILTNQSEVDLILGDKIIDLYNLRLDLIELQEDCRANTLRENISRLADNGEIIIPRSLNEIRSKYYKVVLNVHNQNIIVSAFEATKTQIAVQVEFENKATIENSFLIKLNHILDHTNPLQIWCLIEKLDWCRVPEVFITVLREVKKISEK